MTSLSFDCSANIPLVLYKKISFSILCLCVSLPVVWLVGDDNGLMQCRNDLCPLLFVVNRVVHKVIMAWRHGDI